MLWAGDDEMGSWSSSEDRVVADAMCQNLGPAVLKYDGQRIGEIQHEARSHYSASSKGPW